MKFKKFGLVVSLLAVALFLFASCAMAAEAGYLKVGETKYETSADIAKVCNPVGEIVKDGSVIEVYGKVNLPLTSKEAPAVEGMGKQEAYFILSHDNVTVEGKTNDACLYTDKAVENGAWGTQNTITVFGSNVTFKNLIIMPKFDKDGATNKTLEVLGSGFSCINCTFTPNTYYKSGDVTSTPDGGSLYFNGGNLAKSGGLKNILVTGSTLKQTYLVFDSAIPTDNIKVTGNIFDTTVDDDYFYFVGNTTWSTPPTTKMGEIYVANNTFRNMGDGFKAIVKQRMEGVFTLVDNILDKGSVLDKITFAKYNSNDYTSGGKGIVMVTEGGKKYKVTATLSGDVYTNVVTEITSGGAPAKPAEPVIDDKPVSVDLKTPVVTSIDQTTATSTDIANAKKEVIDLVSESVAITSADLDINTEGQVVVKNEVAAAAAADAVKNAKLPAGTKVETKDVAPLPIFSAPVTEKENTAAVAFELKGEDLKAAKAKDVKVVKLLGNGKGEFFNFAAVSTDFVDKAFALQTSADVIMSADYAIEAAENYKLVLFIKDGGAFDLDASADGKVVDPAAIVKTTATTPASGGSSSGCNAGFAALALLAVIPVVCRRKK